MPNGARRTSLLEFNGILIPGGFGKRGIEGKIDAIRTARTRNIPFLGLCLGFQLAVVEYSRNVIGWEDATSAEFGEGKHVIAILPEQESVTDLGGTMRLGNYPVTVRDGTMAMNLYHKNEIVERHRHRYEVNPQYPGSAGKGRAGLCRDLQKPDGDPGTSRPPLLYGHTVPPRVPFPACPAITPVPGVC